MLQWGCSHVQCRLLVISRRQCVWAPHGPSSTWEEMNSHPHHSCTLIQSSDGDSYHSLKTRHNPLSDNLKMKDLFIWEDHSFTYSDITSWSLLYLYLQPASLMSMSFQDYMKRSCSLNGTVWVFFILTGFEIFYVKSMWSMSCFYMNSFKQAVLTVAWIYSILSLVNN